jgi:hypothetical protein
MDRRFIVMGMFALGTDNYVVAGAAIFVISNLATAVAPIFGIVL